jgi:hypothetical protein
VKDSRVQSCPVDQTGRLVQPSRTKKNQKIAETSLGLGLSPASPIFLDQIFILQNTPFYLTFLFHLILF